MTMRPLHRTLAYLEDVGLEVRDVTSIREHYVLTVNAWARRLDDIWDEAAHLYGARRARIWRLYLTGVASAFERNRMSVHQILAVHSHIDGASGLPLRPNWLATEGAKTT
jgi:cyclopropane-fatty-acyl-phospholipid synthase